MPPKYPPLSLSTDRDSARDLEGCAPPKYPSDYADLRGFNIQAGCGFRGAVMVERHQNTPVIPRKEKARDPTGRPFASARPVLSTDQRRCESVWGAE